MKIRKKGHLLLSFLFPQLNAFLLSSSTHLVQVECFVLIAVHPEVILRRTSWRLCRARRVRNRLYNRQLHDTRNQICLDLLT